MARTFQNVLDAPNTTLKEWSKIFININTLTLKTF